MRTLNIPVQKVAVGDTNIGTAYGDGLVLSSRPCLNQYGHEAIELVVSYLDGAKVLTEVYSVGCQLRIAAPWMQEVK